MRKFLRQYGVKIYYIIAGALAALGILCSIIGEANFLASLMLFAAISLLFYKFFDDFCVKLEEDILKTDKIAENQMREQLDIENIKNTEKIIEKSISETKQKVRDTETHAEIIQGAINRIEKKQIESETEIKQRFELIETKK